MHGTASLPEVRIESYNLEIREKEGFIGDRASEGAFRGIIEKWREHFRQTGSDPLGDTPTARLKKSELDRFLHTGDAEAVGVLKGAIGEFSRELAEVIRRFRVHETWSRVERIVIGGGFQQNWVSDLAVNQAADLLKTAGIDVDLVLLRHEPHDGGLIGSVHLVPPEAISAFEGMLAVDIGGSNIRAGIVRHNLDVSSDLAAAEVAKIETWRHAEEDVGREEAVDRLVDMLQSLIDHAGASGTELAPLVGVACPGVIRQDGLIERGAQNLPGDWEDRSFNLPDVLRSRVPEIRGKKSSVIMHNDAVVQGLSEQPFMRDVLHWGVLTVGTGLGNASFTNKS